MSASLARVASALEPMSQPRPALPSIEPPLVGAPPRFIERRRTFRRAADRIAHRETVLLARSLDILAEDAAADARLAGLLQLLASTVGARRAAVLADGADRRVAVWATSDQDEAAAVELGSWLDAWAPRARAARAAAGAAAIAIVRPPAAPKGAAAAAADAAAEPARHFACLPIPSAGQVVLGFDFADEHGAAAVADRLPRQLARHAAVALALVTEQVAAERELSDLRNRETERTRFVSTVAHELRTPLTGLKGYLELMLADQVADPADQRDFLDRSRQIVETMGDLVGDLLELSRLESDTLRLELAPFSVAESAGRVVAGLAPIALARSVDLRTDLPPRLRSATGDRRRVEQILTNLCANAMKFAPPGSTMELAAWFDGRVALIAVRDEGGGIGAEDRARIFERFYRMAGHERVTGTGLGLPIARDLARAMGGDLDVASVPAAGSSFVLALPGPAGSDVADVATALAVAIEREEYRLEERAVLRAIGGAGRRTTLARLPVRTGAPAAAEGRPRLRSLPGSDAARGRGSGRPAGRVPASSDPAPA